MYRAGGQYHLDEEGAADPVLVGSGWTGRTHTGAGRPYLKNGSTKEVAMARVTGIGGVFFQAKDPEMLSAWYLEHLGVPFDGKMGCAILRWNQDPEAGDGATVWCLSKADSDGFKPSKSSFMINYRVDDMVGMLENLQAAGVAIQQGPETHFNGIFSWILDPEGNKVELWQPIQAEAQPG